MKIAVAGTGYVGLSIATLLSQKNEVVALDVIPEKVEMINNRKSPIRDEKIEEFRHKCLPEFNQNNSEGAALVVTTFVKNCVGFDRLSGEPVNECANGWGYYDLGLQNENFVLKSKELGLDTLIMGIRDGEAIREFFNLPENEQAVSVIAVGYGTKDAQMPKRKSVSDIAKFY